MAILTLADRRALDRLIVTVDMMRADVEELAKDNRIEVVYHSGYRARAWRKSRKVRIATVKSDITYAVALHEIGHILGRHPSLRIDKEVAAWEWAKTNALTWTPAMQNTAVRLLGRYVAWSRRSLVAKAPGPDHPVFKWVDA
jgi:hypothetical protein